MRDKLEDFKRQVEHLNACDSVAMSAIQFIMKTEDPDAVTCVNFAESVDISMDWTSMDRVETYQGNNPMKQNVGRISIGKLAQLAAYGYVIGLDKIREETQQMEERYKREAAYLRQRIDAQISVIERLGGATI